MPNNKLTLIEIFRSAANTVLLNPHFVAEDAMYRTNSRQMSLTTSNPNGTESFGSGNQEQTSTSLSTVLSPEEIATYRLMTEAIGVARIPQAIYQQREHYYNKCFPIYRKQFQYNVNNKFPISRSKPYISTAISPDATKFVVLSEKKWAVYKIATDYNDSPILLFSGKSTGEITKASNEKSSKGKKFNTESPTQIEASPEYLYETEQQDLASWSHQIASLSNRYLAISGTEGILRVYDLERNAKAIYHYRSKFNIRFMTISCSGHFIACATTGINKQNANKKVPIIVLHWFRLGDFCPQLVYYLPNQLTSNNKQIPRLEMNQSVSFQEAETVSIEIPYNDVINTLSFSADDSYIVCSTKETSHILIINITNHYQPRLLQRLSRRYSSDSEDSEGITCVQFHPGNQLLSITSAAPRSYPVIISTDISTSQISPPSSFSGPSGPPHLNHPSSPIIGDISIYQQQQQQQQQPSISQQLLEPLYSTAASSSSPDPLTTPSFSPQSQSFMNQIPQSRYTGTPVPLSSSPLPGSSGMVSMKNNGVAPTIYSSTSSATASSKLKVVMRVEKVGSMIHRAAISPRPPLRLPGQVSNTVICGNGGGGGSGASGISSNGANNNNNNINGSGSNDNINGNTNGTSNNNINGNGNGNVNSNLNTNTNNNTNGISSISGTTGATTGVTGIGANLPSPSSSSSFSGCNNLLTPPSLSSSLSGISVAYLDKNGLVYLMNSLDKNSKRIVVLTEVASASNFLEAASLRFTPTGHALFILDRKGNFHIQDFAAGYPQQPGISKCRILG